MPLQWITDVSTNHNVLVYGLIVVMACAEGPILSMVLGVLIRLGCVDFLPAYAALMAGDLIGDVVWYWIGYHFGHRFVGRYGKYFGVTEEGVAKLTRLFHRYKYRILFLSKISNGVGLSLVTLTTAAMVRIPFKIYMLVNLLGQLVWTGFLLGVGYFFSNLYVEINNVFWRVSIVIVAVVILAALSRCQKNLWRKTENLEP
jgi:membrane protein DedA with SNARE-associated domain